METTMPQDTAKAPAMLSETQLREIEGRVNAAAKVGSLSLPAMLAFADIPALLASHRAQAQTIAALSAKNAADGKVAVALRCRLAQTSGERDAWKGLYERQAEQRDRAYAAALKAGFLPKSAFDAGEFIAGIAAERDATLARAAELGAHVQRLAEALADAVPALRIADTLWHHLSREEHVTIINAYNKASAALTSPEAPAEAIKDPEPADDAPGWSFWNQDAGQEWLPEDTHPVDSGECDDAENIEAMTYGAFLARYCPNLRSRSPEVPAEADTLAGLRSLAWRLATALDGAANCARLVERHTTAEGLLHALRLSITAADRVLPDARAAGLLVDDGAGLLTNASEGGEHDR